MRLSHHATCRFAERFPGHCIKSEFSAAVPYAPQYEGGCAMLSPCGAVFILASDGTAVTVKTKEQFHAHLPIGLAASTASPTIRPEGATLAERHAELRRVRAGTKAERREEHRRRMSLDANKLRAVVAAHVAEDRAEGTGLTHDKHKRRLAQLKEAGYTSRIRSLYGKIYCEERERIENNHRKVAAMQTSPANLEELDRLIEKGTSGELSIDAEGDGFTVVLGNPTDPSSPTVAWFHDGFDAELYVRLRKAWPAIYEELTELRSGRRC